MYLAGFENNKKGDWYYFNFILSNGLQTIGRRQGVEYCVHMIPLKVIASTKSIRVSYDSFAVLGFQFLDF